MTELPVTDLPVPSRCAWCRRILAADRGPGRPRTYCRRSCRQRAYEARQAAQGVDWAAERLRGQASVIDEVTVLWRMLGDVLEPRSLGPLEDLAPADVGELVDRLRVVVAELGEVVQSTSSSTPTSSSSPGSVPEPLGPNRGSEPPERT